MPPVHLLGFLFQSPPRVASRTDFDTMHVNIYSRGEAVRGYVLQLSRAKTPFGDLSSLREAVAVII